MYNPCKVSAHLLTRRALSRDWRAKRLLQTNGDSMSCGHIRPCFPVMMDNNLFKIFAEFQEREGVHDVSKAISVDIMVVSLAAASAGPEVVKLYRHVCDGLTLEKQKLVQRRMKEALIKTGHLYGTPKVIQALFPLFKDLKDEEIDHYGARYNSIDGDFSTALFQPPPRAVKGAEFFDNLWGPTAAQENKDFNLKYCPDLHFLVTMNLNWLVGEDAIYSPPETCMLDAAAMICSNNATQAMWHVRGVVRQGGTIEQARLAQDLALKVAELYEAKTGDVVPIDKIEFENRKSHA